MLNQYLTAREQGNFIPHQFQGLDFLHIFFLNGLDVSLTVSTMLNNGPWEISYTKHIHKIFIYSMEKWHILWLDFSIALKFKP